MFLKKKYLVTIQTCPTQIVKVHFLFEKHDFNGLLKVPNIYNYTENTIN